MANVTNNARARSREIDRFRGCLLGLAVGDAVGTTVEFSDRDSFAPLTDMVGGGPFELQAGEWTDDTSMALCLAASLLSSSGFDPDDQMQRYCAWRGRGYLSSNGRCFDIGNTVASSLRRYLADGEPYAGSTDSRSSGNGSIMRLAPVPMFYAEVEQAVRYAGESSRTTHGSIECVDGCRYLGWLLFCALTGASKAELTTKAPDVELQADAIKAIARGGYMSKSQDEIRGSGYVVHSLEAALWCFWQTSTFEEAVLQAANLGEDADTTAAVCGQIAGAFYGAAGIPAGWLAKLALGEEIGAFADALRLAREGPSALSHDVPWRIIGPLLAYQEEA